MRSERYCRFRVCGSSGYKGRQAALAGGAAVESAEGGVIWVSISPRTAIESVRLPGEFHNDPADRMIVALARETNSSLVTADQKIRDYAHVRCIC
jgi:PIN domain nuclease of toxin-antitoxin system